MKLEQKAINDLDEYNPYPCFVTENKTNHIKYHFDGSKIVEGV